MLMIGICQFFTRQNFPNPDSSKFSTVKNLRHTVCASNAQFSKSTYTLHNECLHKHVIDIRTA